MMCLCLLFDLLMMILDVIDEIVMLLVMGFIEIICIYNVYSCGFCVFLSVPRPVPEVHPKALTVPYFDGSFYPFLRSSYFPGE